MHRRKRDDAGGKPGSAVRLYSDLLPAAVLTTVDRPVQQAGVPAAVAMGEWGAAHHHNLDLAHQALAADCDSPSLGRHDAVVFCEILEHLPVNATQLISELLDLLYTDGLLYLTTPNVFSLDRVRRVLMRQNPQDQFYRRGEDRFATTHVREYAMAELFEAVAGAGGRVVHAAYSDCWADPDVRALLSTAPALRSNLVVLACRAEAAHVADETLAAVQASFGPFSPTEWQAISR